MDLTFGEIKETPIGPLSIIAGDNGLRQIAFTTLKSLKAGGDFRDNEPSLKGLETVSALLIELSEFLYGIRKTFSVDVDWNVVNGFQRDVLHFTYEIQHGEILTYGEIAARLGKPKSARAVGQALGGNPMPIVIPCHRVIGSDKRLRGFAAPEGIKTKAFLLGLEGHKIKDDRLVLD